MGNVPGDLGNRKRMCYTGHALKQKRGFMDMVTYALYGAVVIGCGLGALVWQATSSVILTALVVILAGAASWFLVRKFEIFLSKKIDGLAARKPGRNKEQQQ